MMEVSLTNTNQLVECVKGACLRVCLGCVWGVSEDVSGVCLGCVWGVQPSIMICHCMLSV